MAANKIWQAILALAIAFEDAVAEYRASQKPVALFLPLPITFIEGKQVMDYQMNVGETDWFPLLAKNAEGQIVPAPTSDVDSVSSSDASLPAVVDAMPSGPLAGSPAIKVGPATTIINGINVSVTDTGGLTAALLVVDVLPKDTVAKALFIDIGDVVKTFS